MSITELPTRLFKEGAEPNGERVHSYSDLTYLEIISASLDPEDLHYLKSSQFGPLLELGRGSAFSGKLVHFLLTRQLVVRKKNEFWFVFAGSPIWFSISEFERVTGLTCQKPPKEKLRKRKRTVVPGKFWYRLFDRPEVSVEWVVNRLKKRLVPDRDTRIRYALLAIIDGVLCPTSGKAKISPAHVDMVDNIDKFVDHSWGTISFQMTLRSINARGPEKLKKKSISLQGFPHALQLVLLQCVPTIREMQFPSVDDDPDSDFDDVEKDHESLWNIKLDIVWKVDAKANAPVSPILSPTLNGDPCSSSCWVEDDEDVCVDNMMTLISKGQKFQSAMFVGGLIPDDIADDKNDNNDVGSTHDGVPGNNEGPSKPPGAWKKMKTSAENIVIIEDGVKQYVDMRAQVLESRLLQAITEAEARLHATITSKDSSLIRGDVIGPVVVNTNNIDDGATQSVPSKGDSLRRSGLFGNQTLTSANDNIIGSVMADVDNMDGVKVEEPEDRLWHSTLKRFGPQLSQTKMCGEDISTSIRNFPRMCMSADSNASAVFGGQMSLSSPLVSQADSTCLRAKDDFCLPKYDLPTSMSETRSQVATATVNGLDRVTDSSTRTEKLPNIGHVSPLEGVSSSVTIKKTTEFSYRSDPSPITKHSGYDMEQMQKLSRITSSQGDIDFGAGRQFTSREVLDILALKSIVTPPVMDMLINTIRIEWESVPHDRAAGSVAFLDATFVSELLKHYPKFTKATEKGLYVFDQDLLSCTPSAVDRVYLPFVTDKNHWVVLCVHLLDWRISVLDCFTSASREPKLKNSVNPLGEMLPYLIRVASGKGGRPCPPYKAMVVSREKNISQASFGRHSGIMSALLMRRHAGGGVEGCTNVNIADLYNADKQYIISAYELANGPS